jgi:hypothetical protein
MEMRMPSKARVKCCYGCRGAYVKAHGSLSHARGIENRIRRVMFATGLTRDQAAIWVEGFRHGRRAEKERRARGLVTGSRQWERSA